MSSYFIRQGNTYRIAPKEALNLENSLPAGNYAMKKDQEGNFYLQIIDLFTEPKKLYGDIIKQRDRILATFLDRPSATGVLLNGEKGSGKTLLAKQISNKARESGISTIVINHPYHGDTFNKMIQDIEQPCIILFDEFEKVYDKDHQDEVLTLLDGVYPSKKLFILTVNDKFKVNNYMKNRPGRIFYNLDFTGLSENFIREYCEENLENKSHIDRLCEVASLFDQFNFDMLKAMVEDMNRYNEAPQETLKILNVRPEYNGPGTFKAKFDMGLPENIKVINTDYEDEITVITNPLVDSYQLSYRFRYKAPTKKTKSKNTFVDDNHAPEKTRQILEAMSLEMDRWYQVILTPRNITSIDGKQGIVTYNVDGKKISLIKEKYNNYRYSDY